jgi:hypothetical protein
VPSGMVFPVLPSAEAIPAMNEPSPNNHRGTLGVRRLTVLASARDLAILETVAAHRLVRTRHVYELHFWNHASYASGIRACTGVLARLESHRLIRRLSRPVGGVGGGSSSTVWALDVAGDRLLRHHQGSERGRRHNFEPSTYFLAHTLAIADIRVQLEQAARAGAFELLGVACEPNNWRSFPGELGKATSLKPDLALVTAAGDFEDHWFLEVDLGTELTETLIKKSVLYERYRASGREQAVHRVFPRVIWIMNDVARADRLRHLIAAHPELDARLFTVATFDQFPHVMLDQPTAEAPEGDDDEGLTPQVINLTNATYLEGGAP